MTKFDIHPGNPDPKVRFFMNSFSIYTQQNKEKFMADLEYKEKGEFKTAMANKEYYIVVTGEYHFHGPEYDCPGCGEKHRPLVVEIDNIEDYTSQLLKDYKRTGELPSLGALCDWLISLDQMKKSGEHPVEWYEQEIKATNFLITQKYPEYERF